MTDFSSLGLKEELLKGVSALGFEQATPIQEQAIPALLGSNHDHILLAGTGTGKTAAFGLPLLQGLDPQKRYPQALVLSPTRELCCQIASDLTKFAAHLPGIKNVAVYGGASIGQQIKEIKQGAQVVIATPGRLIDLIERGKIDLGSIENVVLDEADEMLSMGFREELERILSETPEEKRTSLFSATMPAPIRSIVAKYLHDPQEISVIKSDASRASVDHQYLMVRPRDRFEALKRCIARESEIYGIIFCRTKDQTREVANQLSQEGLAADAIHGDLSQMQREYVMDRFRKKIIRLLVATDVAARGIDVDDLTHVIHYEMPNDGESYVHRSGRTGRAGKAGISLALAGPQDDYKLRSLGRRLPQGIRRIKVPQAKEIVQTRIERYVDELIAADPRESLFNPAMAQGAEKLLELSREELVAKLLHREFAAELLNADSQAEVREAEPRSARFEKRGHADRGRPGNRPPRKDFKGSKPRFENRDFTQVLFGMGKEDGVTKPELINLANRAMKGTRFPIGAIRLQRSSATIEVPAHIAGELAKRIDGKVL